MELDFPLGLFASSAEHALQKADTHLTHEAAAQRQYVLQLRLNEAVRCMPTAFHASRGHVCQPGSCQLIGKPPDDRVYECPRPMEHPMSRRNYDNSVLHRWSGDVFICYTYGIEHVCTATRCDRQTDNAGETVCGLTGRCLGAPICAVMERPNGMCFESGKAMTSTELQMIDIDAIRERSQEFSDTLPENAGRQQQLEQARRDALEQQGGHLKRTLDPADLLRGVEDVNRSAGPIGRIGGEQKLLITSKQCSGVAPRLATPADDAESVVSVPFSISTAGNRPTEAQIQTVFRTRVDGLFDLLETAYSLEKRREELLGCQGEFMMRYSDRRKTRKKDSAAPPPKRELPSVSHSALMMMHRRCTEQAFEGMDYVWIMATWAPWTSGEIRRRESARLVHRMTRVWDAIRSTPKFQTESEPHLFRNIAGCLLYMVINGYKVPTCMDRKTRSFFMPCHHRTDATSIEQLCAHRRVPLPLIAPSIAMTCLLGPTGMRRRALDPTCGHILRHMNDIIGFYDSQMDCGLRARDYKERFYVDDCD